jgi:transposase-like protein
VRQVRFSTIGVRVTKKQTTESPVRVGKTAANGTSSNWSERAPRPANGQRPERRDFSNDYKLSILAEYDRCSEPGEKGALLRREGLYSSIITDWRRQHREGVLKVTEGRGSDDHPSHPKSPTSPGSTRPNQICLTPLDIFRSRELCDIPSS